MQGLNIDTWYKGLLAASVAIAGMAGLAKSPALVCIALGVACLASAAWAGETRQISLYAGTIDFPAGKLTHTYFRIKPPVVLFTIIGLLLMAWGGFLEARRELIALDHREVVASAKGDAGEDKGSAADRKAQR